MAFVDVALVVGSAVGLEGGAAILGGGALIGAGVGGLYSGITGDGNILNSMLTGGLIGGAGAYGLGSMGVGGEAAQASMAGPFWGTPASTAVTTPTAVGTSNAALTQGAINPATGLPYSEAVGLTQAGSSVASQTAAEAAAKEAAKNAAIEGGKKVLGYGLAGTAAMQLLGNKKTGLPGGTPGDPGNIRPYEFHPNQTAGTGTYPSPYATASYDAAGNPVLDTRERNYFDQQYTAMTPYSARSGTVNPNTPIAAAGGGLMAAGGPVEQMSRNVMGGQGNMFPQSQQEHTYFATPTQMPASAEVIRSDYDAKTNPYTGVMMANGGRVKGYAMGGSALGGIGQLSAGGFSPFSNINQDDLRVTSGGYNEQGKPVDGLGNPIDYSAARSQPFGQTMQGLSSMFPGAARTTPLPDSMQARDAQYRTAEEEAMMKQQSTGQSTYPSATDPTQGAFGRGAQGYPSFSGGFGNGGSGGGSGGPFPLEGQYGIIKMANGGIARYADKGMVDEEEELRKIVKRNLQKLSPEQMQSVMGAVDEQQFLRKNMPNYAEAMRPSISSMVEGAQYGDRMAQSYGGQPRDVNVMPRVQDERNYGGIASIGQQIDPNTRMNFMADLQRTPYDRNALESVRRVGAGIDRKIGKDANLSAYYEQDPMGRNKASGLRYTQNFAMGGAADLGDYSDGGRLLRGPGDGVSDDIPATIAGKQPARLADGEFVIPARIVSEIGNGSTDAGAKRLYAMMDRIQAGRKKTIGKKNVAKDTKAKKHLLA